MKKIKNVLKKKGGLLLGIVIGGVISGGGVYAIAVASTSVSYNNSTSGLTSTNVQGAIDELYDKSIKRTAYQAQMLVGLYAADISWEGKSTYNGYCKKNICTEALAQKYYGSGADCDVYCSINTVYKALTMIGSSSVIKSKCSTYCNGNSACQEICAAGVPVS